MSEIKAIIWDFAGVILHTVKGTFNSLLAERLGVPEPEITRLINSPTNDLWDINEIDDVTFFTFMLNELHLPLDRLPIIQRFVVKDFYVDQTLLAYIKKRKEKYVSMLLTNFPAHIHNHLKTEWNVDNAFDHIIASCDVKLLKPDPAMYQIAIERAECQPHESVFIDDRVINVEAAKAQGMKGILFENVSQTINDLDALLK